jgi:hypothetical protein
MGLPCAALVAWIDGDVAAFRRALASRSAERPSPPISAPDRATRELLLGELLLAADRPEEALPQIEAAARARSSLDDLLPWRRAEAQLLRGIALVRLGRGEGHELVRRSAPVLAAAVPDHRFLRLASSG